MWNFKGTLWNSTQNILPIHWRVRFLYNIEILRALRFKSSYAFLKRPPGLWQQRWTHYASLSETEPTMTQIGVHYTDFNRGTMIIGNHIQGNRSFRYFVQTCAWSHFCLWHIYTSLKSTVICPMKLFLNIAHSLQGQNLTLFVKCTGLKVILNTIVVIWNVW